MKINKLLLGTTLTSLLMLTSCVSAYTSSGTTSLENPTSTSSGDSVTSTGTSLDDSSVTTSVTTSSGGGTTSVGSSSTSSGTTSSSSTSTSTSVSSSSSTSTSISGKGYVKYGETDITIQEINNYNYQGDLPSLGESKILIVPVQLSGEDAWTNTMLNTIETAFFGTAEETNYWESVSSFYKKSSYGKLNITGEVAPVLQSSLTVDRFSSIDSIISQFESDSRYDSYRPNYDLDNDGLIEAVAFIYSNETVNDNFWAWVGWNYYGANPSYTNPGVYTYMWASYPSFIGSSSRIDAHTYIHETGHLFGLDDLYCYDDDPWDCAGAFEMQSYNIGDQGAYMKYSLGWVEPYYVDGSEQSTTIEIRPSSEYGDAIIINDNWNGHAMDEYIMIDFYTPTGNNQLDSEVSYGGFPKMYSENGIRIAHIDSRMMNTNSGKYIDSLPSNKSVEAYVAHSNSYEFSVASTDYAKSNYKLNLLCDSGGNNTYNAYNPSVSRTSALWTEGETFIPSKDYFIESSNTKALFNDGSEVGYKITVDDIKNDGSSATVTITKI